MGLFKLPMHISSDVRTKKSRPKAAMSTRNRHKRSNALAFALVSRNRYLKASASTANSALA